MRLPVQPSTALGQACMVAEPNELVLPDENLRLFVYIIFFCFSLRDSFAVPSGMVRSTCAIHSTTKAIFRPSMIRATWHSYKHEQIG